MYGHVITGLHNDEVVIIIPDIVIGDITVTGNTVEVSANYRAAGWILMILIDSNGTEHRRYCRFCTINLL